MTLRMNSGEKIVYQAHPSAWTLAVAYLFTLGLYELWRRATTVTVTSQRVVWQRGLVTRSRKAVPVDMTRTS
jgi:hypothetical protein